MSENPNIEVSQIQPATLGESPAKLTRRDFFRKAKKAAIGISTATLVASEAQRTIENKIETPYATFYPFYELHNQGVDLSSAQLPQNLDMHWAETIYLPFLEESNNQTSPPPDQISIHTSTSNLNKTDSNSNEESFVEYYAGRSNKKDNNFEKTLDYLRIHNIPLANGDVLPIKLDALVPVFMGTMVSSAIMDAAIVYFASKFGIKEVRSFTKKILPQLGEDKRHPKGMLRRNVLKAGGIGAIAVLGGTSWLELIERSNQTHSSPEIKAASRILTRIIGIFGHAKPYDNITFLRNVMWADKFLDLSQKESKTLGRKVNISYQAGAAHSGLEDFLILGRDFCQAILKAYPKPVLEELVKINNGIDNIAKTRIFKVPTNESGNPTNHQSWTITDEQLRDILKDKALSIKKT